MFDWNPGQFLTTTNIPMVIRTMLWILIGLPIVFFLSRVFRNYVTKRYTAQQGMIVGKVLVYAGIVIIVISVLNEFGFKLAHIFAAAGIIGIAVGFAAQTSISNIISGFFLMAEQPFVVNDVITVDATTGIVLSIDILSVKLRTFDNKFVRIPNEIILKSEVTNITRFPIRRVDINVGVAYKEDVNRVKEILLDIANKNPLCLQEPEPIVIFQGFGKSSIDFMLGVWAEKADWLALKNAIQEEIKKRFDREGIEIPFPHVTVYSGSASRPFRVERVEDRG